MFMFSFNLNIVIIVKIMENQNFVIFNLILYKLIKNAMQWIIDLQCGTFYLFIAIFFATQNIGGTIELVVLLWLSVDI